MFLSGNFCLKSQALLRKKGSGEKHFAYLLCVCVRLCDAPMVGDSLTRVV